MTLSGENWKRLCDSKGVERLLIVESASKCWGGVVPDHAFKNRKRHIKKAPEERPARFFATVNAGTGEKQRNLDLYPGTDRNGNVSWPSTSQIRAFSVLPKFIVNWQTGQVRKRQK